MNEYEIKYYHLRDAIQKLLQAQKKASKSRDPKDFAIVRGYEKKVLELCENKIEKTLFDLEK